MKKFLSLLSVGALACMSVMAAINWSTIDNLAKGATVTVSSNPDNAQNIVDGNNGTGWQASAATHEFTHDWVLINLGSEKTFTDMEIVWEASHCTNYSVYVSKTEIPYAATQGTKNTGTQEEPVTTTIDYNAIEADWLATHTAAWSGGNATEAGYTENITFTEPQTGQYILIYADDYNNFGSQYGMFIFDVKIANIENRDEIASLQLSTEGNAVAGGDAVTVNVVPVNKIGEPAALDKINGLTLAGDNDAVTIAGENGTYQVSATTPGTYTLTATATADGKDISGSIDITFAYNWSGVTNIATGKEIQGRVKAGTEDSNPPANAVDGNLENYYQYNGDWNLGDSWLLVDLGDEYMVDAIGAYYSTNAGGKCVFGYATDDTAVENYIKANGTDFRWTADLAINNGWTFTAELSRTANIVTTQSFDTPVVARYIVVKDADNPQGKPCINEIYVSGTVRETPKADKIELTLEKGGIVIGETNTVTASVLDQYGAPFTAETPEITVTGAQYADGTITGNAKGMVTVTATLGELTAETKFFVADQNDYCMAGCEITASEGAAADKAPVYDGGKEIGNWGADYVLAANEPAGEHTHWFLVKLAKPYNIDLIAALWEGASPADYNIYLGSTENDLQLYYSEKDKAGMQNHSDRFSGKEMNNIQYIKVETTKNATEYGIKLHDLKVYGISNVESVPTSIEVSASANNLVTGETSTLSAKVLDQFGAEMEGQNVTYSAVGATIEGNTFSATAMGDYTVTATCGEAKGETVISVVAEASKKLTAEAVTNSVYVNGELKEGVNILNPGAPIEFNTYPTTIEVNFSRCISCELIALRWETACPSAYTVEAIYQDGTKATIFTLADRENGALNPVDKIINSAASTLSLGATGQANLNNIIALKITVTDRKHNAAWNTKLFGLDIYGTDNGPASGIDAISVDENSLIDVYTIQGIKVRSNVNAADALLDLPHGIYIAGGRKVIL